MTNLQDPLQMGKIDLGGFNNRFVVFGSAAFAGSEATGTIKVPGGYTIDYVSLTWAQAPNTDEQLYVASTVNTGGVVALTPGAQTLTIGRTGTKTADAKFFFCVFLK